MQQGDEWTLDIAGVVANGDFTSAVDYTDNASLASITSKFESDLNNHNGLLVSSSADTLLIEKTNGSAVSITSLTNKRVNAVQTLAETPDNLSHYVEVQLDLAGSVSSGKGWVIEINGKAYTYIASTDNNDINLNSIAKGLVALINADSDNTYIASVVDINGDLALTTGSSIKIVDLASATVELQTSNAGTALGIFGLQKATTTTDKQYWYTTTAPTVSTTSSNPTQTWSSGGYQYTQTTNVTNHHECFI